MAALPLSNFLAPLDNGVVRPAGDFASEDDQSDDSDIAFFSSVKSLPNSQTIPLSIRATYTKWTPREAFRELIQNWRDGIIASFRLTEQEFIVESECKPTVNGGFEAIYKVPRPNSDSKEWLGFVHYKSQGATGMLEITNREATLDPWHLDMGGTSKANVVDQAGAHGEGLKVALLVLMRGDQNHKVRCRSGGYTWTFNFAKNGRLVARLNRISEQSYEKLNSQAQTKFEKTLIPFCSNAKRDVQFILGEPHKGRSDDGLPIQRRLVSQTEFKMWTSAVLFLQSPLPDELVRTEDGDLLIGQRFRKQLYLKGLLLNEDTPGRHASVTNKPLRYGYNFASGSTNRERQSVAGAYQESATILSIWTKAILSKPELVGELSLMLNSQETKYADVDGASTCIGKRTVLALWAYLTGGSNVKRWYFSAKEKRNCHRLHDIIHGLGYEGLELGQVYWDILRQHNLVRTADEQQRKKFREIGLLQTLEEGFSTQIGTIIQTAVRSCELTKGTTVRFARAGALDLQSLYIGASSLFVIHERLVSLEGALEALGLPLESQPNDVIFHAVIELFTGLLEQLPASSFLTGNGTKSIEWQRKAHVRLVKQRLFDHARLKSIQVSRDNSGRLISCDWRPDLWPLGTAIEIQCYSLPVGKVLQNRVLIAADMIPLTKMFSQSGTPAMGEDTELSAQGHTLQTLRTKNSRANHKVIKANEAQDYMLLFCLPTDERTFVCWKIVPRIMQHRPAPDQVVNAARTVVARKEDPILIEADGNTDIDRSTPQNASYELGQRLTEFNIMSVQEWYKGVDKAKMDNKVVIGLLQPGVDDNQGVKRKQGASSDEEARSSRPRTDLTL